MTDEPLRFADVAAGVAATIAAYCHALDEGRTDDLVALFTADGVAEFPGMNVRFTGHDEMRTGYARWRPRNPQRHIVSNTQVLSFDDHTAEVISDLQYLAKSDTAWSLQMVGTYRDTFRREGSMWLLAHRITDFQ